ncbi:response regulator [Waterburya agarophytonicola K14]|uniref:Response regulator n=1 Tax=Waterburya agarophytonicola KI4 TaxID=2874699 RepID=A0A964FH47_9CYAN|nr:response regulator [Waterburya agarophytonicola]MCC0177133.1 response regulator [Waterburya agarophytonicola KI4]
MKTILVIEDEAQTRKVLLNCLKFEGFKAIGADNGKTGIKLAQEHCPDLIVCDIMMPEMNGYDVLSILRQKISTLAIPVIFLTAKVSMFDLRLGMDLGAEDYLTKPCNIERFLTAITTRLRRKEELQKSYAADFNTPDSKSFFDREELSKCSKTTKVFEFIEANFDRPLELKEVASNLGYSPAYLTNFMRQKTGRTVKQWIVQRRMDKARQLLLDTEKTISQIAIDTGYVDTSYFIRQFKRLHGTSPNLWRNSSLENTNCS